MVRRECREEHSHLATPSRWRAPHLSGDRDVRLTQRQILPTMISFFFLSRVPVLALFAAVGATAASTPTRGAVRSELLRSTVLQDNRVGLDTERIVKVYLPP